MYYIFGETDSVLQKEFLELRSTKVPEISPNGQVIGPEIQLVCDE